MKKYFNRIKDELDAIVEEKAMGLKDLSIELEVHEKTVKEVYNRIDQRSIELSGREGEVEEIHKKIDNYDTVLKELSEMTARVDENLKKLHEESLFVDGIGKKLKESSSSIDKLEHRIPQISEDFSRKNSENMELLKIGIFNDIGLKANSLKEKIEESRKDIQDFTDYMNELEKRRDRLGDDAIKEIRIELEDLTDGFRNSMSKMEEEFRARLFETDEKGIALSEDIFSRVKKEIDGRALDINSDMDGNLALLEIRVKEKFDRISSEMTDFEKNIQDKFVSTQQAAVKNYQEMVENIKDFEESISGQTGRISDMRKDIEILSSDFDRRVSAFKVFIEDLDNKRNFIISDITKKLDNDVNAFVGKFRAQAEEIEKKYLSQLSQAESESEKNQNTVFTDLKKQVMRNAESVKNELLKQIEALDMRVLSSLGQV
jgi:hypothetical protein